MSSQEDFVWFFRLLLKSKWRALLELLCFVLVGAASTLDPLLMQTLIDQALPKRQLSWALGIVGGIAGCYFVRSLLSGCGNLLSISLSQRSIRALRHELLDQLNRLSPSYHEQTPTGEKLTRLERDVEEISRLGADSTSLSVRALLFLSLNIAMMASLNLQMTLTVLPLVPLFAFVQQRFRLKLTQAAEVVREEVGKASSLVTEHVSAVPQIQFLNAIGISTEKTVVAWDGMQSAQWNQRQLEVFFSISIGMIFITAISSVLAFGSVKVLAGKLTIGGLVAFYTYVTRLYDPINATMELYSRLQSVRTSIRRVRELLALTPTVPDLGTQILSRKQLSKSLNLSGINFSYGEHAVLRDINLCIKVGEHIGIIGASGSGKSTLARLLVRAADPASGHITFDGISITAFSLKSLRSKVGYIPQHPILFSGSVKDNLLYADPNCSASELQCAIDISGLGPVIDRLPKGLETFLGPSGGSLSGGEQQRVAIARALLQRPEVLLLDEATSALDVPTERHIFLSLKSAFSGKTLILISHRISAITWVDRFVVLQQGEIAISGDHTILSAESAIYRSMLGAHDHDIAIH